LKHYIWLTTLTVFTLAFGPVGCDFELTGPNHPVVEQIDYTGTPHVLALDENDLQIGQTLYIYGENFLPPSQGKTYLEFNGHYVWTNDDGQLIKEQVHAFTIAPLYDGRFTEDASLGADVLPEGTTILRWNRFGPFLVPFNHEGRRPGSFEGTIEAVNILNNGEEIRDDEPETFFITIEQSVLITRLEPIVDYGDNNALILAECGSPALRVHSGLPYIMEVEAIGFEPAYFIYELYNVNGSKELVKVTHQASGAVDRLGDPEWNSDEVVIFNPVLDDEEFSIASIRVVAVDVNNNAHETGLPIPIVRPVHFAYDGNRDLAEFYEPVVVHGPIVGGIATTLTYAESHTEARQRGVSVSISQSFTQSQGTIQSNNWSEGISISSSQSSTNSVGVAHSESESTQESYGTTFQSSASANVNFSSTDGTSWGWNLVEGESSEEFNTKTGEVFGSVTTGLSTEVSGEGSIPGFAKVGGKVGTSLGVTGGAKSGNSTGEKTGASSSHGSHMDGSSSDSAGFGSTTTDSKSDTLSGSYGLTSQTSINNTTAETQASSESMTYNMGGSEGLTENFSKGNTETWQETWSNTATDQNLLSFSGKVPNGRCAVVYRQTVRHVRKAHLYSYNLCGVRSLVGELFFNEWSWSPNIAIGDHCESDLPASTLPKAQCFRACD